MLELVRRSGDVVGTPRAVIVYANDIFEYEMCLDGDKFRHVPWYMRAAEKITEPGEILGAFVRVVYKAGGGDVYFHPIQKIHERRERSKAKDAGPWKTDYEAMVLKTAVRAAFPWLPMSIEDRERVEVGDERVVNIDPETMRITSYATDDDDTRGAIIEVDGDQVNTETGEVVADGADMGRPFGAQGSN